MIWGRYGTQKHLWCDNCTKKKKAIKAKKKKKKKKLRYSQ
jgi:hypothetical protein